MKTGCQLKSCTIIKVNGFGALDYYFRLINIEERRLYSVIGHTLSLKFKPPRYLPSSSSLFAQRKTSKHTTTTSKWTTNNTYGTPGLLITIAYGFRDTSSIPRGLGRRDAERPRPSTTDPARPRRQIIIENQPSAFDFLREPLASDHGFSSLWR